MQIELILKKVWPCKIDQIQEIDSIINIYDLIIVTADHVPQEQFSGWLSRCKETFKQNNMVWTPAIILADLTTDEQLMLMPKTLKDNWYFDVVSPSQLTSVPMRAANLLRIHEHLKELYNYDQILHDLKSQVLSLEEKIKQL